MHATIPRRGRSRALLLAMLPVVLALVAGTACAQAPGPDVYEYTLNPGSTMQFMESTLPKPWLYTYKMSAIANSTVYFHVKNNESTAVLHNVTVTTVNQSITWAFQGPIKIFWSITNPSSTVKARFTLVSEQDYGDDEISGPGAGITIVVASMASLVAGFMAKHRIAVKARRQ